MVTIVLTLELEEVVTKRAKLRGTTPALLALEGLREKFLPASLRVGSGRSTMAEALEQLACLPVSTLPADPSDWERQTREDRTLPDRASKAD